MARKKSVEGYMSFGKFFRTEKEAVKYGKAKKDPDEFFQVGKVRISVKKIRDVM